MVKRNAMLLSSLCSLLLVLFRFGSIFINKKPRFVLASIPPQLSMPCEAYCIALLHSFHSFTLLLSLYLQLQSWIRCC
jgi:hypothetical protein